MYINLIAIDCILLLLLRFAILIKTSKAILLFKTLNINYARIKYLNRQYDISRTIS